MNLIVARIAPLEFSAQVFAKLESLLRDSRCLVPLYNTQPEILFQIDERYPVRNPFVLLCVKLE